MHKQPDQKGFSIAALLLSFVVIVAIVAGGWAIRHRHGQANRSTTASDTQTKSSPARSAKTPSGPSDPTGDGKYLYIKEWGIRTLLPADLQGEITYTLASPLTDENGNQIQAAKILVKNTDSDSQCAITSISGVDYIQSAAQLLQVQRSRPFDASRYTSTVKTNLLVDDIHAYELNYITPDCAGPQATQQIEELQSSLTHLEQV